MDLNTLHRRTVESWERYLDGVAADQWDLPTPCTEWDVRALVNHVVGEDRWTRPLLQGMTIAEVGDRFDGDLLGDDPQAVGHDAATDASAAIDELLAGRRHRAPVVRRRGPRRVRPAALRRSSDPRVGPGRGDRPGPHPRPRTGRRSCYVVRRPRGAVPRRGRCRAAGGWRWRPTIGPPRRGRPAAGLVRRLIVDARRPARASPGPSRGDRR